MLNPSEIAKFQKHLQRFYSLYGRHTLPWRQTTDPYHIMVSEIMLQQTQVDRVIPKFLAFIERFPTPDSLATAPVSDVIKNWQGLGYNRRALNLQRAAQHVVEKFKGVLPQTTDELLSLPGIGPYTTAAIQAFAFNQPSVVIETNIRTVFIFHFFHGTYKVEDAQLLPLIEATLDHENPRQWYSALMDYGTHLKTVLPNPTRQSKTYVKQSKLAGSNREVRGKILKILAHSHHQPVLDIEQLVASTQLPLERLQPALAQLEQEGFITQASGHFQLA